MRRILLVRLSSLGDVLHTFPAVTDLARALPGAELDWVVEEAYVPLVRMHPAVGHAIPFALRRWRGGLLTAAVWREIGTFRHALRDRAYDAVIDAQGLVKSAWVADLARGPVHGYTRAAAREPLAARFYRFKHDIAPDLHSVERYRRLLARVLGYVPPAAIDYSIAAPARPAVAPEGRYAVLLHSTARAEKLWSEASWTEVGRALESRGLVCVLPWGDDAERERAGRLARSLGRAVVPPRLSLVDAAGLIGHAAAVVGLDTGLMHLAVALRTPVVAIFCSSAPARTGPLGSGPIAVRGGPGDPPSPSAVLAALDEIAPALA
jgi:lipopolysaccharide heptosyltransferase I